SYAPKADAPSIDLDDAWLVFLRDRLGLESLQTETQLFAATLLDRDGRGKALASLLATVPGAREELAAVLERRLGGGGSAPLILAAWLDGASVELAAFAAVGEAARGVLSEGQGPQFTLLTTVLEMRVLHTERHPLAPLREKGGVAA